MSEGVCDMSTGIMYYESATRIGRPRTPGGIPGAAVRVGRLLELWGYRAARSADRAEQLVTQMRSRDAVAHRAGGPSSAMASPPRIY
jgi:hypothetical protein